MKTYKIPFNKPYLTGKETDYIKQAVDTGHISGNGTYTKKCQSFFQEKFGIRKALLTSSCTDALEMSAILCKLEPGDEVIMPSYTFVSTANAFVLRGAKIVFCDSRKDHPGMDEEALESLITPKTKVIVPVHYAGVACNMEKIMELADQHGLLVVEDAAQAIDSYFTFSDGTRKALGSIGHLGTFSFHETKNIISGEGGLLAINDPELMARAEIIWEKGTNRSAFFRGEVNKYGWVDIGSSFLPSEVTAAFLWAQLEQLEDIQNKRLNIWHRYDEKLSDHLFRKPLLPEYATNNAHMYYVLCKSSEIRKEIISTLKENDILSVFHYLSLHTSEYFSPYHDDRSLEMSDIYSDRLLRLPLFYGLNEEDQTKIISIINQINPE